MNDFEKLILINRWCGDFYTSLAEYKTDNGGHWYGYLRYGKSVYDSVSPTIIGPATSETVIIQEAYTRVQQHILNLVRDITWEAS